MDQLSGGGGGTNIRGGAFIFNGSIFIHCYDIFFFCIFLNSILEIVLVFLFQSPRNVNRETHSHTHARAHTHTQTDRHTDTHLGMLMIKIDSIGWN